MAKKHIGWLMAVLASTPFLYAACGGDDDPPSTTAGTAGTGGAGGSGTAGTAGKAGSAGAPGGASGSAGKDGGGGSIPEGGPLPDNRTPCGTVMNGCTQNPTSTNICDLPNNRCVECLNDTDCADENTAKTCDTTPGANGLPLNRCVQCVGDAQCTTQAVNKTCDRRPSGMTMIPAGNCVACIDSTQCPTGGTCTNGQCFVPCGTVMNGCTTNPTGNNICDATNNRCVDCLNDTDCSVETENKFCDTSLNTAGLPRNACEQCVVDSNCPAGNVCIDNECEPSCTTDAQCARDSGNNPTPFCNPTIKICAECATDAHCMTQMNQPYCSAEGSCEECTTDAHCSSQPTTPFCRLTDNNCVACRTNADCPAPQTCSTNTGRCSGGEGGTPDSGGGTPDGRVDAPTVDATVDAPTVDVPTGG